jgi:Tol biopolymer transport system component
MARMLPLLTTLFALALTAPASATLVYQDDPAGDGSQQPTLFVAADDGTGARPLTQGEIADLSPDGSQVAYTDPSGNVAVIPTAGGAPRVIAARAHDSGYTWSPDSTRLAITDLRGAGGLTVVDVASGRATKLARGAVRQASWSPDGRRLAFDRELAGRGLLPRARIFLVDAAGGAPQRLATKGDADGPIWGRRGIAFVHLVSRARFEARLIRPDGRGEHVLAPAPRTNDPSPGVTPTGFDGSGTRLIADDAIQDDQIPPRGVALTTGAARPRTLARILTFGISRDGGTVLGTDGVPRVSGGSGTDVVTVPWTGGAPTVLVPGGAYPDWDR